MNPTEYFRFVQRLITVRGGAVEDARIVRDARVLQQWWEGEKMIPGGGGEWRDVPLLPDDNTSPYDWPE